MLWYVIFSVGFTLGAVIGAVAMIGFFLWTWLRG